MSTPVKSQKELQEQFIEVTKLQHNEWLKNPVTQHMLGLIRLHRAKLGAAVEAQATDTDVLSEAVRYNCVSMKNTKAILTLMENQELFINKLVEQLKQTEQ